MYCSLRVLLPVLIIASGCGLRLSAWQRQSEQRWDQFLGPSGNGHSAARNLPIDLSSESALAWRTDIPGRGWSSPLVLEDEIWLTTAIEQPADAGDPEPKTATAAASGGSAWSSVQLQAVCLDRHRGGIKRTVDLFAIVDPPAIHSLNSFASPTPVTDGEVVYCHFGAFGTAAVARMTGAVIWRNTDNVIEHEAGPGSSPILHNGLLIMHCDGCDQQYVCALNASDGRQVWRTDRSGEMNPVGMYKKAFCTPIVISRGQHHELVSPAANWVYGYDPATGQELWRVSYGQLGFSNVARPLWDGHTLYVCSCFMQSKLLAIDVTGDQPLDESRIKWTYQGQVPNMPSPIIVDGLIYFTSDRGIITCLDSGTGERKWQDRLGRGFSASPLYADGKLFWGDHDGKLHVLQPSGEEMNLLATHELDSQIMASPAAVDDSLFVRTATSLYHFRR